MDMDLSCSGVTRDSCNGIDPSGLVTSVVNWIWGFKELMSSRPWFLCSIFLMTKVSSTYILQNLVW